jgi:regulator of sigma E protease
VKKLSPEEEADLRSRFPDEYFAVMPGDKIVGIDGTALNPEDPLTAAPNDYYKLDQAVQKAGNESGRPVELQIVRHESGKTEAVKLQPRFVVPFGKDPLNFAGMLPRTTVGELQADSSGKNILRPGDIVVRIVSANDPTENPTFENLTNTLNRAGQSTQPVEITVLRGDKRETFTIKELKKVGKNWYGLGFGPGYDSANPLIAGSLPDSPAAKAGIPAGAVITSINGAKVANWFDIQRIIAESAVAQAVKVTATHDGKEKEFQLTLAEADVIAARNMRYSIAPAQGALAEQIMIRKAENPLKAAWWGVTETRDFILQFYVTIRRMFDGSVSYTNLMGPLGIFTAGTQFAFKGTDWLIWFLAMISANLAVVNFLPIPVVDGGHFVFLCLEKVQGKPVSQRAQSIAQVVGLALLLGVFLLVTYQDINRMIGTY